MDENYLDRLSLPELYHLLVENTRELLQAINANSGEATLRDLSNKVEAIQSVISLKKKQPGTRS